jgi:nicotinamidase-related amidase
LKVNSAKLIKGAKILDMPILWLEQNPEKLGRTEQKLNSLLEPLKPITKYTFNACEEPEFVKALKNSGVKTWLVCGIEAHICVYQTALGLRDLSFEVEAVCDCISSRSAMNKELAISKLTSKGISITSLEMCLYELIGDCRAPEFKKILDLIK